MTALVSTGLNSPAGVAVDDEGNVYFADYGNNAIKEWIAATQTVTTLVSTGLDHPFGVAVDASGNVYFSDFGNNAVKEWNATTRQVSTLVSSGLNSPTGVAVDASGNVYVNDSADNAVKEWVAATGSLKTLVSAGLNYPEGVAVDASGDVYLCDSGDNAVDELPRAFVPGGAVSEGKAAGNDVLAAVLPVTAPLTNVFAPASDSSWLTIGTVSAGVVQFWFTPNTGAARPAHLDVLGVQVLVTQAGVSTAPGVPTQVVFAAQPTSAAAGADISPPVQVSVEDSNGNVVTSDDSTVTVAIGMNPGGGSLGGTLTVAAVNGVATFSDLWIDKAGTGYTLTATDGGLTGATSGTFNVVSSTAAKLAFTTQPTSAAAGIDISPPVQVSVEDANGNVVAGDTSNVTVAIGANPGGGTLGGTFTVASVNGVATFGNLSINAAGAGYTLTATDGSLTGATSSAFNVTVAQSNRLGVFHLLEGPAAGADSDIVITAGAWTATANASWLHTSSSGTGNGLAVFSLDANTGASATGTLTIAGATLTVTQAGSGYVPAASAGTLVSSGLTNPTAVAVDSSGNLYIADYSSVLGSGTIKEWNASTGALTTLVSSGLNEPEGLAIDGSGNLYIADYGGGTIKEWNASTGTVTSLFSTTNGTSTGGVALDSSNNVYFDTTDGTVWERNALTGAVTTFASGLNPLGPLALDALGNIYISEFSESANFTGWVLMWNAATQTFSTLIPGSPGGSGGAYGLAVDGSGNVYVNYTGHIEEVSAATQTVSTLVLVGAEHAAGRGRGRFGQSFYRRLLLQEDPRVAAGLCPRRRDQ